MERRSERIWLLLAIASVAGFTLAPFDTSFSMSKLPGQAAAAFDIGDALDPIKWAAHVVAFFLLGTIVAAVYEPGGRVEAFVRLWVIGGLSCIVLEAAQLFESGRHARVVDVLLNITGLGAGLWAAGISSEGRKWRGALQAKAKRRPYLEAGIFAAACILWWSLALAPALGCLQMNWDTNFPLAIANEIGGDRAWLGDLSYCGIYHRALSSADVLEVHNKLDSTEAQSARIRAGLSLGYDFRKAAGATVEPEGGLASAGSAMVLPIPALVQRSVDGLRLVAPTILRTPEAARGLTDAIVSAGAFSVEVWMKPQNLFQAGPARLVTVSTSTGLRNFTLGQAGRDLVFRVRNRFTNLNGSNHEMEAISAITPERTHFVAVYDHGVSMIYKEGRLRDSLDLREPLYYSNFDTGVTGRAAFFALAVTAISFSALSLISRQTTIGVAVWLGLGATMLICGCPYVISCLMVGGPWRFTFFAWLAATLLVVYVAGAIYVTRREGSNADTALA